MNWYLEGVLGREEANSGNVMEGEGGKMCTVIGLGAEIRDHTFTLV